MKKICFLLVLFLCPFCVFAIDLASNAKSAIIIEPTTGKIIFEKNSTCFNDQNNDSFTHF